MMWPKQQWEEPLPPRTEGAKGGEWREWRRPSPPRSWGFLLKEATSLRWPIGTPALLPSSDFLPVLPFGLGPTMRTTEPTGIRIVHIDSSPGQRQGCQRMEKVSGEATQRHPAQIKIYLFLSKWLLSCPTSIYQIVCPFPDCLTCYISNIKFLYRSVLFCWSFYLFLHKTYTI